MVSLESIHPSDHLYDECMIQTKVVRKGYHSTTPFAPVIWTSPNVYKPSSRACKKIPFSETPRYGKVHPAQIFLANIFSRYSYRNSQLRKMLVKSGYLLWGNNEATSTCVHDEVPEDQYQKLFHYLLKYLAMILSL